MWDLLILVAAVPLISTSYVSIRQGSFPACSMKCFGSADYHGCSRTDYVCLCRSSQFVWEVLACVRQVCGETDAQATLETMTTLCWDWGINITAQTNSSSFSTSTSSYSTTIIPSSGTSIATSETTSSPPPSATSSSPSPNKSPSSTGAVIGGAIGGVVVVAALIISIWLLRGRRRRSSQVDLFHGDLDGLQANNNQSSTQERASVEPMRQPDPPALTYVTAPNETPSQMSFTPYSQPPGSLGTELPLAAKNSATISANPSPTEVVPSLQTQSMIGPRPLPSAPSSSPPRSPLSPPTSTTDTLPITADQSNRLSIAQLQSVQSLIDRNIKASTLEAIVDSMLAAGPSGTGPLLESRESPRAPAPPSYDANSSV